MIQGASEGWKQTLDRLVVDLARMLEGDEAERSVVHGIFTLERLYATPPARVWLALSLATIQLRPEGKGTRLTVTEQRAFLDGYDDAGSRERGTAQLLDSLGESLGD